jgi:hypothetical protein
MIDDPCIKLVAGDTTPEWPTGKALIRPARLSKRTSEKSLVPPPNRQPERWHLA